MWAPQGGVYLPLSDIPWPVSISKHRISPSRKETVKTPTIAWGSKEFYSREMAPVMSLENILSWPWKVTHLSERGSSQPPRVSEEQQRVRATRFRRQICHPQF